MTTNSGSTTISILGKLSLVDVADGSTDSISKVESSFGGSASRSRLFHTPRAIITQDVVQSGPARPLGLPKARSLRLNPGA